MHRIKLIIITLLITIAAACGPSSPPGGATQFMPPPPPAADTPAAGAPEPASENATEPALQITETLTETPSATFPPITAPPESIRFAAIGDYGQVGPDAEAVADLVKSFSPDFIITLGDNNYPDGTAETIDANIGQYYHEYIHPYNGVYGPGAETNRFFPSPGNHDWNTPGLQPYLDYFELPGNERYYDFVWGPVHFFALDADTREPDGVGSSSVQGQWLKEALAASTAPWQVVYMHQAPYSSARHGSTDYIQWPFAEWGADAVLAGHDHTYERLEIDGIPYFVNGLGGHPARYFFFSSVEGSRFQYRAGHGAQFIEADENSMTFEFVTVEQDVLDRHQITREASSLPDSVTSLPAPDSAAWEPVYSGFQNPLLLLPAGDGSGRLFVVEQTGAIRMIGQDAPFLDLSGRITTQGSEQGLLGLAFDPDFANNGFFYVNYTDRNGDTVISRFTTDPADPNRGDPGSEEQLLFVQQPYRNHNGGHLTFGPDGLLYAGLGDGGAAGDPEGNAQAGGTFLGKLVRIEAETGAGEIYASGLRNPWRFSFDSLTGDLYIGDVGQGNWEEIDFLRAGTPQGANFGWDYFEGTHAFEGVPPAGVDLISPVFEYSHAGGHCSVTGGFVYRGAALPDFFGVYLFSDYCSGVIWGLVRDEAGAWTGAQLYDLSANVTSFGTDETGELYLVAQDGTIYKLTRP